MCGSNRYPAPEDALKQERILREQAQILQGREQLMRQQVEEELAQERIQRSAEEQARIQAQQELGQERRSMAFKMLQENISIETIARITEFTIEQIQAIQAENR